MSRKKRNGKKATHHQGSRANAARAPQSPPSALARKVQPEAALGTILEALAPVLFESPAESTDRPSGTYDTREARLPHASPDPGRGDEGAAVRPPHLEQRESARVALAVEIGLVSDSHFFCGLSGDVSEGGLFVQTYRELPVGRDIDLDFELPGGHVTAHGKVRWQRSASENAPPGIGITFEHLEDDAREIIHAFCEQREPLYYDVDMD